MIEPLLAEIAAAARSVAIAVVPLAVLFLVFQVFLLGLPRRQAADILKGTAIAAVGLFLFLLGVAIGFLPFGRAIGMALIALDHVWLFAVGMMLGFLTALGEPAIRILAGQVEAASNGSIRKPMVIYAICAGVALWVGLGLLRISFGISLVYLLVPGYLLVLVLLASSDRDFLAVAADAGGVATGPLSNSFLLALALGASAAASGQDPMILGLGFVALIALAPIISVMILGLVIRFRSRKQEKPPC